MPQVFALATPIEAPNGDVITQLTINRNPNTGDFWDMPLSGWKFSDYLHVFGQVTGTIDPVLKRMHPYDMQKAVAFVDSFIQPPLAT